MLTINDLIDQIEIQGYVIVKNIKPNGDVETVFGGGIDALYPKYRDREVVYIYSDNNDLVIEVREENKL